nr:MAG TPA: hypothetical protein [Caudoviricetes sp.]
MQRQAACLHVPLFYSLGKPNTPTAMKRREG